MPGLMSVKPFLGLLVCFERFIVYSHFEYVYVLRDVWIRSQCSYQSSHGIPISFIYHCINVIVGQVV